MTVKADVSLNFVSSFCNHLVELFSRADFFYIFIHVITSYFFTNNILLSSDYLLCFNFDYFLLSYFVILKKFFIIFLFS